MIRGVDGAGRADDDGSRSPGRCPACASPVEASWRHCGDCGTRLDPDDPAEREHVVTAVVSDLQGSTALAEALDPESLRLVLDRYFDELGAVLESHGGRIEKRIGDMMVTVFGLPEARPDDAVRALRAAAQSQQTLAHLNDRLERGWGVRLTNRTGVSTGRVVYATAGGAHRVLAGDALDVAGALEPVAPPLEVLVSPSTAALVDGEAELAPAEAYRTKAGDELTAHRLLAVTEGESASAAVVDPTACGSCGLPLADGVAWCTSCGSPRAHRVRRNESRRTLTIVFIDLHLEHVAGDVRPAAERAAMLRAFGAAREALDGHGATVENFIGDAVMAVFGLDRRHEDDALRAVRAALEVQERLAGIVDDLADRYGIRIVARIGVNTGAVIAGDPAAGERLVTGDAVNVAARLEQTARAGAVVIGELTRQLAGPTVVVDELPPLTLKGKAEPVPAYHVRGLEEAPSAGAASRFELPMVGRDAESGALAGWWSRAIETRTWQRVRVRGDAGIGKSRLVYELLDGLGGAARVLRGSCLPYGAGITFWPIAEIVRAAAGITPGADVDEARRAVAGLAPGPEVAVRLHALLGLDPRTVPVPELIWAVRQLLEHLASQQPLVVVVDGLQWAEPTLLELLDDVAASRAAVPALMITMERGGDADAATGGVDDARDAATVTLDLAPLDERTCDDLIIGALGADALPLALRRQIIRASAGVPLFVEQLLTMLIDDGRLQHDGSAWRVTVRIEDLDVPPTIEALLAARIDALPDDELHLLEPASVIGREFALAAVAHLTDEAVLDATVESLARRQLVGPTPVADAFVDHRFRNLLIRDVVYGSLLKRQRAALHEQIADWMLTGPAAGRIAEVEEIIGYHLERAHLLAAEVAAVDDAVIATGQRASRHLGAAGERAFARGDMPAAANLLERAARTLHGGGSRAARLLVLVGDARLETGDFSEAVERYDEAERLAVAAGDPVTAGEAVLARTTLRYLTGDGVDDVGALATVDELLPVFEAEAEHGGSARCWRLRTYVEMFRCRWGAAETCAAETITHAQQAGDTVLERRVLPALAGFALYGPTPVPVALARCQELLVAAGSDPRSRALILQFVSHLSALDGDDDHARDLCASARASLLELGWNFDAALVSIHLGPIELMAGHAAAAERELRADYDTLRAMGERNYLSTTAYLLAEAVRRQGRTEEALELAAESESLAAPDDVFSQIGWRSVRVRALAELGRHAEARELADEALRLAEETDGPNAQGEALLDIADLLARTGDAAAARATALRAVERFTLKQNRVAEARALAFAAELA